MKKIELTSILLIWVLQAFAFSPSGICEFHKIKLEGKLNVILTQGDVCSVKVEVKDEKVVTYKIAEGELTIKCIDKRVSFIPNVYVTFKNISEIETEGVTKITNTAEIVLEKLSINIEGVSNLSLFLKTRNLTIKQEAVGNTELKGSTDTLTIKLEGVGSFDSKALTAAVVLVDAEGIGSVAVYASESIKIRNEGIGLVEYIGNPKNVEKKNDVETVDAIAVNELSKDDTTRLKFGQRRVLLYKDTLGIKEKKQSRKNTPRPWKGIGFSLNGYVNQDFSTHMAPGFEFMEQNYAKSIGYHWNFLEKDINLYKRKLQLSTGMGLEWNRYAFKRNVLYNTSSTPTSYYINTSNDSVPIYGTPSYVSGIYDSVPHKSSKLCAMYLTIPVILSFNFQLDNDKIYSLSAGIIAGGLLNEKYKIKYTNGGVSVTSGSSAHMPFLKCDATVRLSHKRSTLFCNYRLTRLYEEQKGPHLHPFAVGFNYRMFK